MIRVCFPGMMGVNIINGLSPSVNVIDVRIKAGG